MPRKRTDLSSQTFGYLIENCVPCCVQCNLAKGSNTEDEFKEWIQKASKHLTHNHR